VPSPASALVLFELKDLSLENRAFEDFAAQGWVRIFGIVDCSNEQSSFLTSIPPEESHGGAIT